MSRQALFTGVASTARFLPHFRGKHRAVFAAFKALGLADKHTIIETEMTSPVRYRAYLDLHSWLQRLAYVSGGYEGETVRFLLRLWETSSYGCLLDIGANVGLISIPFALLAPDAHVVAVEAVSDNWRALTSNIKLNDLARRISALNLALGDESKQVEIQVEGDLKEGDGTGTANIMPDDSTYACERIPLQLHTLDSIAEQIGPCSVIKIDTDGYDLKILEGGRNFITDNRPVIFGEFSAHCMAWHGQGLKTVEDYAASSGYTVWAKTQGEYEFSPHLDASTYVQDLLLIPSEKRHFQWCLRS